MRAAVRPTITISSVSDRTSRERPGLCPGAPGRYDGHPGDESDLVLLDRRERRRRRRCLKPFGVHEVLQDLRRPAVGDHVVDQTIWKSAGIVVDPTEASGSAAVVGTPIRGSAAQIADGLRAFGAARVTNLELVVWPPTLEALDAMAPVLELLDVD